MRRLARAVLYLSNAAVVFGLAALHARFIGHYEFPGTFRFAWATTYFVVICVTSYAVGLPETVISVRGALGASMMASGLAAVMISAAQLATGSLLLPRYVVFGTVLVAIPVHLACVALATGSRGRAERRDRVVAAVSEEEAHRLSVELEQGPERPALLVDVVGPTEGSHLLMRARSARASVVVLDHAAQVDEQMMAAATVLHAEGLRVRTLTLFYEEWFGKLPLSELERISLLFDIRELHQPVFARTKRLFDVVVALVGVGLLLALFPLVLVGNAVGNRGPLLFRQQRIGRGGAPFTILKLRTMRSGDDRDEWTSANDPRVTPFGGWLRRTHIDELPQVVNILTGALSVVGPRPEQPRYVEQLTEKLPFYPVRHLVRPGLTGWAQVKYSYGSTDMDAAEKLQYEFFYLRRQSLSFDLQILGRTLRSVALRGGR